MPSSTLLQACMTFFHRARKEILGRMTELCSVKKVIQVWNDMRVRNLDLQFFLFVLLLNLSVHDESICGIRFFMRITPWRTEHSCMR